jgi:hypothetical protein
MFEEYIVCGSIILYCDECHIYSLWTLDGIQIRDDKIEWRMGDFNKYKEEQIDISHTNLFTMCVDVALIW